MNRRYNFSTKIEREYFPFQQYVVAAGYLSWPPRGPLHFGLVHRTPLTPLPSPYALANFRRIALQPLPNETLT